MTLYAIHIVNTETSEIVFKSIPLTQEEKPHVIKAISVKKPYAIKQYDIINNKYV